METWFRLPLVVRVAVIVLAWFGYAVLVLKLNTPESAGRIAMFVGFACVMGASVTAGADQRVHGKYGSIEQLKEYRRALRTGELPANIDVGEWQRWLRGSAFGNAAATPLAAPFVLFGWASSLTSQSPYRWAPASAFALVAAWGFVAVVRKGARIRRLTTEVKRLRDSPDQAAAGPANAKARASLEEEGFRAGPAQRTIAPAVVGFISAFLVLLVADLDSLVYGGPRIVRLEWAVAVAALVALACAALGVRRLRRNFATFEQYTEYNRTVRTGKMPTDIEPDVWRRRLRGSRTENLLKPLLAGFLVAVGVSSILTSQSVYHWVTASLFELLAMWFLVKWWAMRERLTRLAADVERHAVRQSWG